MLERVGLDWDIICVIQEGVPLPAFDPIQHDCWIGLQLCSWSELHSGPYVAVQTRIAVTDGLSGDSVI